MQSDKADSSPFDLLVNAANAQSQDTAQKEDKSTRSLNAEAQAYQGRVAAANALEQQRGARELEWREALQRDAFERDKMEREALEREVLQRRAAFMGFGGGGGGGGFQGIPNQETEYMQQLRLEALVQQRRQETLAQLALSQEMGMSQDLQAFANAQQLRQAALMRQEMLLGGGNQHTIEQQLSMHLRGLGGSNDDENMLIQQYLMEERERQYKLASIGLGPMGVHSAQLSGSERSLPPEVAAQIKKQQEDEAAELIRRQRANDEESAAAADRVHRSTVATDFKTTSIPCRARGMPVDHTVKTAYFVIPDDTKHGTELLCSYYACRHAGTKFRYCAYCKVPVAKRNFFMRHKHQGKIPEALMPETTLTDEDSGGHVEERHEESQIKKVDALTVLARLVEKKAKEVEASDMGKECSQPNMSAQGETRVPLSAKEIKKCAEAREDQWDQLLCERPHSIEATIGWAQRVLAVSDLDTPLEGEAQAEIKSPASDASPKEETLTKDSDPSKERKEGAAELKAEAMEVDEKVPSIATDSEKAVGEEEAETENVDKKPDLTRKETEIDEEEESDSIMNVREEIATKETATETKNDTPEEVASADKKNGEEEKEAEAENDDDDDMQDEDVPESKVEENSDAASTSSDESVDLRASKKAKAS